MPILLTILLILLLLIVLAVLYLLLVPIDLQVTGTLDPEGLNAAGGLTWGVAGLVAERRHGDLKTAVSLFGHRFWFSMEQGRQKPEVSVKPEEPENPVAPVEESKEHQEEKRGSSELSAGEVISMVEEAWPRITDLIGSTIRALEIRSISIEMTFGLSDAAKTGEVFGYLMAIRGMLTPVPWFSMGVTPVFDTITLVGTGSGTLRLNHPGTLLVPAARLMLCRPVWRMIRTRGAS
jgi:hypothetical protein